MKNSYFAKYIKKFTIDDSFWERGRGWKRGKFELNWSKIKFK